jgi:hypothetical protein
MSRTALAIFAIAILISSGLWLSMRAAAVANLDLLPVRNRRRVRWWQQNSRHVQLGLAGLALTSVIVQLTS